jgi:nicotinamidase/pyrazinamidase
MDRYTPRTALLIVDVQNDFADPRGSLYIRGAEQILPVLNRAVERAEEAGAWVVYTQDWHPQVTPHFQAYGGIWPVHCVRGTWGAALHPALRRLEGGGRIFKGQGTDDGYSGFSARDSVTGGTHRTELEELLRARGVQTVVVAGLATDHCVKATALDALAAGFDTFVLHDAVAAVDLRPGDGERALAEISRRGGHVTMSEPTWAGPDLSSAPR